MRPSTDLTIVVTDAAGTTKTLDSHAPDPADRPRAITFATQLGTGWTTAGFNLRTPIDRDRDDLHLRDDLKIIGTDGDTAYEGFIGEMPRSMDDTHTLTVTVAGWMADTARPSFTMAFVDRDPAAFAGDASVGRRSALLTAGFLPQGGGTITPDGAGLPGLVQQFDRLANSAGNVGILEAWYDAGPNAAIGRVYADLVSYDKGAGGIPLAGSWVVARSLATDDAGASIEGGAVGGTYNGYYTAGGSRRYLVLALHYAAAIVADGLWSATWRKLAVYGNHGLPLIGDSDPKGVAASGVIRWLIANHCPKLNTTGVQDTTYPISQLAFKQRTKVYDALMRVNTYHLWSLAVWEDRTVHYKPIDLSDWDWEIRHDEAGNTIGLQGDSLDNLRNGIIVQYTNLLTGTVDELHPDNYAQLRDDSLDNPYNQHGDKAYGEPFTIPFPVTAADALELGRIRLLEDNQVKAPGSFSAQHHIRDRTGNWQPVWKVRAGDSIRLTSSASLSDRPRLIHETQYNHDSHSLTIGVDSTLRNLEAFLDRQQTALQAAGLG